MSVKERKERILRIAQTVLPALDLKGSGGVLKAFRNQYYAHLQMWELAEAVEADPKEFKVFCQEYFLFVNKLEEEELNAALNLIRKANLPQVDRIIEKALLQKANLLFLNRQILEKKEESDDSPLEL